MKPYVIQYRKRSWDPWEVIPGKEFFSLEEAKKAFEALPVKDGRRIAERYTQIRYKAVNAGAPEPPYRLPTPPPPQQKGEDE